MDGPVGLLGILKVGGGYVPLDPSFPDHRLRLMLDDAKVAIVVTQRHLRSHVHGFGGRICDVETLCQSIVKGGEENLEVPVLPDHLAYIMYTSGSTGRPKGVAVTHRIFCDVSSCQTSVLPGTGLSVPPHLLSGF